MRARRDEEPVVLPELSWQRGLDERVVGVNETEWHAEECEGLSECEGRLGLEGAEALSGLRVQPEMHAGAVARFGDAR